jgi:hypothetical protein
MYSKFEFFFLATRSYKWCPIKVTHFFILFFWISCAQNGTHQTYCYAASSMVVLPLEDAPNRKRWPHKITHSDTKNDFSIKLGVRKSGRVVQIWPDSNVIGGKWRGILRHPGEQVCRVDVWNALCRCSFIIVHMFPSTLVHAPDPASQKYRFNPQKMEKWFSVATMAKSCIRRWFQS